MKAGDDISYHDIFNFRHNAGGGGNAEVNISGYLGFKNSG